MLFPNGVFTPEAGGDERVRAALRQAAGILKDVLGPADLLAGVIRSGDPGITEALSASLRPESTLADVLGVLENGCPPGKREPAPVRTRESFTPPALHALDSFAATIGEAAGTLHRVALEVLTVNLLACIAEGEEESLAALDSHQAATLLMRRAVAGFNFGPVLGKLLSSAFQLDGSEEETEEEHADEEETPPADNVIPVEDLTALVKTSAGTGPFPFDDEPQFERLFDSATRALHRRGRHLLLVGERGVCKDTIITELARRAASGGILSLGNRRFVRADCRHVPPEHARACLAALLHEVGGHHELVVIVDGLASLLRGQSGGASRSVLLPALERARCHLVALVTPGDYRELFTDDSDLVECFVQVDVEEPEPEVAIKVLRRFAASLSQQYEVEINDEAIRAAVVLTAGYVLSDQLPAKALKALRQACEDLQYERAHRGESRARVNADDVVRVVAQRTGVPEATLRGEGDHADFEHALGQFVVGQDHVVREVATELGLIKAGMTEPGRPASVLLFMGQTGVGKTEMARAVARVYSGTGRARVYTLGNCVEPHSVSTLIGVPPGYVGHDKGGPLVNDLNADPYAVFLLDEADKAHPDVLQPFLNLFDVGWVVDQRGVKAYADRAIFILTTNVGQRMMADMAAEGKTPDEIRDRMREVLAQIRHPKAERPVFTPEFLARIKRIIVFNPLSKDAMEGIARKLIREMQEQWQSRRGRTLHIPDDLVQHVAARAHELNENSKGREGGRVVRKLIADWVEAPLQRAISARPGEYRGCESVVVEFTPPESGPSGAGAAVAAPKISVRFTRREAA